MLYDLAYEPPEPNTLLESIFKIIARMRQEEKFLATRLLFEASMAQFTKGEGIQEVYNQYAAVMFPFSRIAREEQDKKAKRALKDWTEHGAMKVKALEGSTRSERAVKSRLKKAADQFRKNKGKGDRI